MFETQAVPDFESLARASIAIFHPEVLDFPEDIQEKAVQYKALKLEISWNEMMAARR